MPPLWKEQLDRLRLRDLREIFRTAKPVIGMVHCWPLPGAPGYTGYGMQTIIDHAICDAEALAEGGCDGLIVENMWDILSRRPACATRKYRCAGGGCACGAAGGAGVAVGGQFGT